MEGRRLASLVVHFLELILIKAFLLASLITQKFSEIAKGESSRVSEVIMILGPRLQFYEVCCKIRCFKLGTDKGSRSMISGGMHLRSLSNPLHSLSYSKFLMDVAGGLSS